MTDVTSTPDARCEKSRFPRLCDAMLYMALPRHLKSTVRIALVVGIVLTLINQADVIASGEATATTWLKCGLNFVVPFVVANLGLLSARDSTD